MNIRSRLSDHWTDEKMIDYLYDGEPINDTHLLNCTKCQNRLASMRQNRRRIEEITASNEPTVQFLASQRRQIYSRLAREQHASGSMNGIGRWASAAAVLVALGGALFLFEDGSRFGLHNSVTQAAKPSSISDAQLAVEVSELAESPEPAPTEPLQALFAE